MTDGSYSSKRDLTTPRYQVFGEVEKGAECRICGRNVDDGRMKVCSEYCNNLLSAVMGMLNWSTVRRRIIDRDDEICQHCGYDHGREKLARGYIRDRIDEQLPERPPSPSMVDVGAGEADDFDWDAYHTAMDARNGFEEELQAAYGDPYEYERSLEVDHITPVADGGHPFDPGNLQTLCSDCHGDKTAAENSNRASTPTRNELNESLFQYVSDGGVDREESGVERRLTCEHGEWRESPPSSLSPIWCRRCDDMVPVEFRNLQSGGVD